MSQRVCLGVIIGVHGIKGLVRIKSYTQTDSDIASYGHLEDVAGNKLDLTIKGRAKSALLAEIKGVKDRTDAEKLKGTKLFIPRNALPAPDDAPGGRSSRTFRSLCRTVCGVHGARLARASRAARSAAGTRF